MGVATITEPDQFRFHTIGKAAKLLVVGVSARRRLRVLLDRALDSARSSLLCGNFAGKINRLAVCSEESSPDCNFYIPGIPYSASRRTLHGPARWSRMQ